MNGWIQSCHFDIVFGRISVGYVMFCTCNSEKLNTGLHEFGGLAMWNIRQVLMRLLNHKESNEIMNTGHR